MKAYDTLVAALNDLKARGFTRDFNLQKDCVECCESRLRLHPEEFGIAEYYVFEGTENPGDQSIVYAIESTDGQTRGVLVNAYGSYADGAAHELVEKLRIDRG